MGIINNEDNNLLKYFNTKIYIYFDSYIYYQINDFKILGFI